MASASWAINSRTSSLRTCRSRLSAATIDGRRLLLAGDIGDNHAVLPERAIFAIEEPTIPADADPAIPLRIPLAWTLRFTYPDGPRDAEGLAWDPISQRIDVALMGSLPRRPYLPATISTCTASKAMCTFSSLAVFFTWCRRQSWVMVLWRLPRSSMAN